MANGSDYHQPVLVSHVLEQLRPGPGQVFIDATVGGAGHALRLSEQLGETGRLLGIDKDAEALEQSRQILSQGPAQFTLVQGSFADLLQLAQQQGFLSADGLLADLGVSSHQLDAPQRGFSFQHDGPLDMRMDQTSGETAAELIDGMSERDLAFTIRRYGEERHAKKIARTIKQLPATPATTAELAQLVSNCLGRGKQKIHPATRTFQALRIAVNQELVALEQLLAAIPGLLKKGGRAGIISFHSLEDRAVKQTFVQWARRCVCPAELPQCVCGGDSATFRLPFKRPLWAEESESQANPRARSARLRVAEKL